MRPDGETGDSRLLGGFGTLLVLDPNAPEDAVLEPGPVAFNLPMPGLGLVFLAGGGFIVRQARAMARASDAGG